MILNRRMEQYVCEASLREGEALGASAEEAIPGFLLAAVTLLRTLRDPSAVDEAFAVFEAMCLEPGYSFDAD